MIGGSDSIEVQVKRDPVFLRLIQRVDICRGADQATLRGPHQAKRTLLRGSTLAICSATSSKAAAPEPLSLMPGPLDRVKMCAGHHTLPGSPCFDSANTLYWVMLWIGST